MYRCVLYGHHNKQWLDLSCNNRPSEGLGLDVRLVSVSFHLFPSQLLIEAWVRRQTSLSLSCYFPPNLEKGPRLDVRIVRQHALHCMAAAPLPGEQLAGSDSVITVTIDSDYLPTLARVILDNGNGVVGDGENKFVIITVTEINVRL